MQHIGIGLQQSMADMLDIEQDDSRLRADLEQHLTIGPQAPDDILQAFREIADSLGEPLKTLLWYRSDWLVQTLDGSAETFKAAF